MTSMDMKFKCSHADVVFIEEYCDKHSLTTELFLKNCIAQLRGVSETKIPPKVESVEIAPNLVIPTNKEADKENKKTKKSTKATDD